MADKVEMQHRLFAEISAMFGSEVPLYDKALVVNRVCNDAICSVLANTSGWIMTAARAWAWPTALHGPVSEASY